MKELKESQMGIIAVLALMLVSMKRRLPTRRFSSGITTLALAGIVLLVAAGSASANGACIGDVSGTVFGPGSTVTESCTLNDTMTCTTGKGLIVDADNIVINGYNSSQGLYFVLDGSTPGDSCTGSGYARSGIYNKAHDNVVIKNLEVKNFCNGIAMKYDDEENDYVVNATIDNCTIHDNGRNVAEVRSHGIKMERVESSTIKNCEIYDNTGGSGCTPACENGGNGIFLKSGNDNIITNNDLYGNKLAGYLGKAGPRRLQVTNNHIWGNHMGGIVLRCKTHRNATIEYNNVSGNYGTGIFIGGPYNTVIHNKVCNNMDGAGATLPGSGSDGCGINLGRNEVDPYVCGARWTNLTANVVCGNGAAGDIRVIAYQSGYPGNNTGDDNVCDTTYNYNDEGTGGCTWTCPATASDLIVADKSEAWVTETTYNVSYRVQNIGNGTSNESVACVYIDTVHQAGFDQNIVALAPNAYSDTTVGPFGPCAPSDTIKVCADCTGTNDEWDETNNCMENTLDDLPPSLVTYTITNTTISPNGDGIMDDTEIDVEFSETVNATILIENASGIIRTLYTSSSVMNPNPKTWDGTDDSSDLVADGTYQVNITMDDGVNPLVYNNTRSIVVANISVAIISIGNASATVTIPITIEDATNVGSAHINITYDASVVNVTNVTGGDFDTIVTNLEHVHEGWVRIGTFQTDNPGLTGSFILANVTFRSNSTNGTSPLNMSVTTFKDATPQCNEIPYIVQNGTYITVLNGDVNGDGVVDIADAMYLAKHKIGITGFEVIIEEAADVDGDGVIDLADAMYLAKHKIGITGFEELR